MDVGPAELLIVLVIALVLFGGKKIPDLARSLGQAKNEFEKGARGDKPEDDPAAPSPVAEAAPIVEAHAESATVAATPVEVPTGPVDAEA